MGLTFWAVGMLVAAVSSADNTIYSSQYKRFVNLVSGGLPTTTIRHAGSCLLVLCCSYVVAKGFAEVKYCYWSLFRIASRAWGVQLS